VRYGHRPELAEALAAEYVLGTLQGRARRRFVRWMREDAALARAVREWEARLNPMALALPPVTPPARLWRAIDRRIHAPKRVTMAGWRLWESLAFWRGVGLVASGAAAALFVATTVFPPVAAPDRLPERVAQVASSELVPGYVAMLGDDSGGLRLAAYAPRESRDLWVRIEGMAAPAPGHRYVLWSLPEHPGEPPRLVGTVPVGREGIIKMAAAAEQTLADLPRMAISVEPAAADIAAPTGPVVAKGTCMKTW
jgi:anti-sigma-K factor RskA